MEIQGQVIQVLPTQTGQGKNGVWAKQEVILETPGQYPKKVSISIWGEENINKYDLETGMKITAHINIESREHSGRWYTEVRAWKIETSGERRQAPAADTTGYGDMGTGPDSKDLPF